MAGRDGIVYCSDDDGGEGQDLRIGYDVSKRNGVEESRHVQQVERRHL